ncbi:MAG: transposase [Bryobacteraceae bacterium]
MFSGLYGRHPAEIWQRCRRRFRSRHKRLSLDATLILLCVSLFGRPQYRRSKRVVKLHLVLNHGGWPPEFAVVTPGRTTDIELVRMLRFEPGRLLVCDCSDPDSRWWMEPTRQGVSFVTRFKNNAERGVVEQRLANRRRGIVQDEVMLLVRLQEQG